MIYLIRGNRIYLIDTMWILGPIAVVVLVVLIKQVNEENRRVEQEWAEHYKAKGMTPPEDIRGGQQEQVVPNELVLVDATKPGLICLAQKGLSYVKHTGYRKLVLKHFKHMGKDGVIFITKSALCQLIVLDGSHFPTVLGISGWANTARDVVSLTSGSYGIYLIYKVITSKLSVGVDAKVFYRKRRVRVILAIGSMLLSLISKFWGRDPGIVQITGTYVAIDGKVVSKIKSRIPGLTDVVSINLKDSRHSLVVKDEIPSRICKIPGVTKVWKDCSPKITLTNPELGLDYDGVVNLGDVVKLSLGDNQKFNDLLDLGTPEFSEVVSEHVSEVVSESPTIPMTGSKKGKLVRFLDKFKDPDIIPENSQWELNDKTNAIVKGRIKNKK